MKLIMLGALGVVKGFIDAGDLLPDSLIMNIIGERLLEEACKTGFLLDGFPRINPQADALEGLLEKTSVELGFVVNLMRRLKQSVNVLTSTMK